MVTEKTAIVLALGFSVKDCRTRKLSGIKAKRTLMVPHDRGKKMMNGVVIQSSASMAAWSGDVVFLTNEKKKITENSKCVIT